jgi:hypothetical protein
MCPYEPLLEDSEALTQLRRTMKNALIAAIVSAVVASTTATAATIVITSKNIKNGTVQLVDISPKAKAALRGRIGPRGPSGFGSIQRHSAAVPLGRNIPRSVSASCPAGTTIVGGGFESGQEVTVYSSKPIAGEAWEVTGVYTGGNLLSGLQVHALCTVASS